MSGQDDEAIDVVCTCLDPDDEWCCDLCRAYARMEAGLHPFDCPVHFRRAADPELW